VAEPSEIAAWLVGKRLRIEQVMASRLGPAAPTPGSSETEALRRFRSYAVASLRRGAFGRPALDGIRVDERRASALVAAWCEAAAEVSGPHAGSVSEALQPIYLDFRTAMRTTSRGRRSRGAPRAGRRTIMAAIDRICDAFFAVDADSGRIVDANPAAAALLGVARDALIDVEVASFMPADAQRGWWTVLDAVAESTEPRRFRAQLADTAGLAIAVDCTVTPLSTRHRTFALVVARPV
jgi:PAS domain S-box-containing protein